MAYELRLLWHTGPLGLPHPLAAICVEKVGAEFGDWDKRRIIQV